MEFRANIHHEDGSYWAEVPELPGCFASGADLNELVEALEEAILLYLQNDESPPAQQSAAVASITVATSALQPA